MKNKVTIALAIVLSITSSQGFAGVWEEREHLERYVKQMKLLNDTVLVQAAESSDPDARIRMRYDLLLHDVNEIVNRIEHHLETPLEEYRSVEQVIVAKTKTATEH
jgi:RAQPRD family integrative conjugative element protein